MENEETKEIDEKEQIKQMNLDLNKINEKFEKEIRKEIDENCLKGNEIKPLVDDNWGCIYNDFDNISDIEKDN